MKKLVGFGLVAVVALGPPSVRGQSSYSIVAWGYNNRGECDVPPPNADFIAIAAGGGRGLGLQVDGSIVAWGGSSYVPSPNAGFVGIATAWDHSLAQKTDGSIVAWGDNYYGQCNIPPPNKGFLGISAGGMFSLGLRADGSIAA